MILTSKSQFQHCLETTDEHQFIANYNGLTLSSVYQPIFDIDESIFGVEALVRIKDANGNPIRPDHFFCSDTFCYEDKINVERLSRVIHLRNFAQSDFRHKQLFLNVLPIAGERLATEDLKNGLLASRIQHLGLKNSQIVMELIELDCENLRYLETAMEKLNQNGFNVAIDDFGVNASTEARVLQVKPHILKMDRSLLVQYCSGDHAPLLSALQLAKRIGAQTVIEGIETAQQLNAMRALNIDLYQGFHLAMPVMLPAKIVLPSN